MTWKESLELIANRFHDAVAFEILASIYFVTYGDKDEKDFQDRGMKMQAVSWRKYNFIFSLSNLIVVVIFH